MDNFSQLISVPVITAICYGVIEIYKHVTNSNEKFVRFIPVIGAVLGMALGIVAFYCAKGIMAADNILTAILIGLSSGLAATGTHQIFKQLTKSSVNKEETQPPDTEVQQYGQQSMQTQQDTQEQSATQNQTKEN